MTVVYADIGYHTFVGSAINPFHPFAFTGGLSAFAFGDLDADGDLDAVVGVSDPNPIRVLQRTGAPAGPISGTTANNTLNGTAADDTIDGQGGADTMAGGLGTIPTMSTLRSIR